VIVIAATFVAEPLELPLNWVLTEASVKDEIRCAPYNQVFQELLTPASDLGRNSGGINVLLIRFEDFARNLTDAQLARNTVERTAQELGDAVEKYVARSTGTLILLVLPPGPRVTQDLSSAATDAGRSLGVRVGGLPGVQWLDAAQIDATAADGGYDSARDDLAHIPYTDEYYAALAVGLARRIHSIEVRPAKVLVLDCDNTLWSGVVGEDGVDGIQLTKPYLALQEFAVALQAKGILLCLASKNTEADVLEVFAKRPEMRLQSGHLVSHRINWQPKPANIRSLAAELNLGLDAFVFIDDNPVECAQMRAELPQVITLPLPPEAQIADFVRHLWLFDKLTVTAEDSARTRMYKENSARRAVEAAAGDVGEFLAALDLKIDIAPPAPEEWPRLEQLTQRTNQFNFTTRRRQAAELKAEVANGAHVLRVRVADRFGDYGLVGALVARSADNVLLVDNLLLSCRVLGRGVEHAMLRHLGEIATASGLSQVALPYLPTARNVPARAFADSVAAEFARAVPEGTVYQIPADVAARIAHQPGHDPAEIIEARSADEKQAAAGGAPADPDRSDRYIRLAQVTLSGKSVLAAMADASMRRRALGSSAVAPTSAAEVAMLAIWERTLGIDGLGVDDDFFELGGTSLSSVQLFAQINRRFAAQLPLTAILDAPTVRKLSLLVDSSTAQDRSGMVCLRPGGTRNLFLVHDGFGETLLYLNLARRLPPTMTVYGIEPRRLPGIPLAHASIEDMAAFYVGQIRKIQPQGPYLLGGMCAGGVIAFQMAACLLGAAERVQMVTILDGATPQAAKRVGLGTRERLSRLEGAIAQAGKSNSGVSRWVSIASSVIRKVRNAAIYEITARFTKISVRLRFTLMRSLLQREAAWPASVPSLTVMQIYNALEARYRPPVLREVPVLLVRATVGEGADRPYRELYRDEDFGWRPLAGRLEVVDVSGGHSSMLQEREIDSLTGALLERLRVLGGVPEEGYPVPAAVRNNSASLPAAMSME
jgi:FkbH-like protein